MGRALGELHVGSCCDAHSMSGAGHKRRIIDITSPLRLCGAAKVAIIFQTETLPVSGCPRPGAPSQLSRRKPHQWEREDAGMAAGLVDRIAEPVMTRARHDAMRAKKPACLGARRNASDPGAAHAGPPTLYKTGRSGSVATAEVRTDLSAQAYRRSVVANTLAADPIIDAIRRTVLPSPPGPCQE